MGDFLARYMEGTEGSFVVVIGTTLTSLRWYNTTQQIKCNQCFFEVLVQRCTGTCFFFFFFVPLFFFFSYSESEMLIF